MEMGDKKSALVTKAFGYAGASAIALLVVGQAHAQDASASAATVATDQPDQADILVTARRRSESVTKVPESVTVFTEQKIEDARIRRLSDFVNQTPGFEIHDGESAGVFRMSIRGITQTNQGDAPVTMVVDGVTLPYANAFGKALFDVSQIEVLKGPQGSLYGQNAIGGAVLITTKQATDEFSGRLTVSHGNENTSELVTSLSGPIIKDKLLFRASSYFSHDDGDMHDVFYPNGRKFDRETRKAVRGDLTANLTDDFKVVLAGEGGSTSYNGSPLVPRGFSVGSGIPGVTTDQLNDLLVLNRPNQTSDRIPHTNQNYWDTSLKADWNLGFATVTSVTAYQVVNEREVQDLDVSYIPFIYGNLNNFIKAFSEELRISSNATGNFHWVAGVYLLNTRRDYDIDPAYINATLLSTGDTDPAHAVYVPFSQTLQAQHLNSRAIFGQAEWDVTSKLQLTLGGRYDIDPRRNLTTGFTADGPLTPLKQKRTFRQFQPKASVRYSITRDINVYATVARGFRPGGFNSGTNGDVLQAFAPETTTAYEIGAKASLFNEHATLSLAGYHTDYKNQQLSLIHIDASGSVSQDNFSVKKTRIQGVEANIAVHPIAGLDLEGGFAYTDGKIRKFGDALVGASFDPSSYVGNTVPLTSKTMLTGSAQYSVPLNAHWRAVARVDAQHYGTLYWEPDNRAKRSPFSLVNLSVGVKSDHWELRAYGNNVFDKRYDTIFDDNLFTGAPGGFDFANISRGARYGIEATYRF
jgi:iron complex outermembrane receptor protein